MSYNLNLFPLKSVAYDTNELQGKSCTFCLLVSFFFLFKGILCEDLETDFNAPPIPPQNF